MSSEMHSVKEQDDWKYRLKDKGKPLSSSLRAERLQTAEVNPTK